MRLWRRRRQSPPPVVLPSLDRLAGLIERVVELVDEVAGVPETAPARAPKPAATVSEPVAADGWLAFLASPEGYVLAEQEGSPPSPGDSFELEGVGCRVLRHAPSPFPGDRRRCVVLEREEPSAADRSSDA